MSHDVRLPPAIIHKKYFLFSLIPLTFKQIMDPIILIAILRQQRRRRRRHNYWVHPLLIKREIWGEHLKIQEMCSIYPDKFRQYTRMSPEQFHVVLNLVKGEIAKQDTSYRKAIPTDLRLFVTLR